MRQFGNLITFSNTPCSQQRSTPMLGQHAREIMEEFGYDGETMDAYKEKGVVTWPDEKYRVPRVTTVRESDRLRR